MAKKVTFLQTQLQIPERIHLIGLLPNQGGFTQLIILKDLKKKLEFTQKELEDYDIKDVPQPNGLSSISYNLKKLNGKKFSFTFTSAEELQLKSAMQTAIDKKQLPAQLIDYAIKLKCSDRKADVPKEN
jgi:hypothetical protein